MTPMIDVVFLLLIFFICTASFQIIEHNLPSQVQLAVPSGTSLVNSEVATEDIEPVLLKIDWRNDKPVWSVSGQSCADLLAVKQKLDALATIDSSVPIIVDVEAPVPFGIAIDAYDVSRNMGFSEIQFAADASILQR